jgi:hypothetical protein
VDIEAVRMSLGRRPRSNGVQYGDSKRTLQEGPFAIIEQQRRSYQNLNAAIPVETKAAEPDNVVGTPQASSTSSSKEDLFTGIRKRFKTMIAAHPFPQLSSSSSADGPLSVMGRSISDFFSSERHKQSYVPSTQPGPEQQHTVSSGSKEEESSSIFPGLSLWVRQFRKSEESVNNKTRGTRPSLFSGLL